jgi:hypothetical protein
MNRTERLCLLAIACLALPLTTGAQQTSVKPRSYEVTARQVLLPPSDPGSLTLQRSCVSCPPVSFLTANQTTYQLDDEVVGLAELKRLFAASPDAFVLVEVDPDYRHVKRVRMWAQR